MTSDTPPKKALPETSPEVSEHDTDNKEVKSAPSDRQEAEIPREEIADISRRDAKYFNTEVEELLKYAEELRLNSMLAQRNRGFIAMTGGLAATVLGASGFGWFLLVDAELLRSLASIILGVVIAISLHIWSIQSIGTYKSDYKALFLPKMAKLLGGFQYHPARGIGRKILGKTGIIPPHDIYEAEDCFIGRYKGVKVMFSEARLKHKKAYLEPIFDGIFVLLEAPNAPIEGHTILTADQAMAKKWGKTRWKKLQSINADSDNPSWNRFMGFSDQPEAAKSLINEALLKELSEAADIFDSSPLTAVFFQKKFIFLMIPYEDDMFEASDIQTPVATKRHALKCKKEIDQLLEVIDVFDIYN